ncbi:MAG: cytochrome c biogenesis protein CcsA [Armatimonas sp.]
MSAATLAGTLGFYLLAAVALGASVFLQQARLRTAGWILAGLGAVMHMAAIGLRCAELHRTPFATSAESLSLLAWLLVLLYLGAQALWRLTAAGAISMGLAFLLVFMAGRIGDATTKQAISPMLNEQSVSLHVVATLAGLGAFALASCCGALFLIEQRLLKSKRSLEWLQRLPPLMVVDRAALTLAAIGFPLLTLGILSGLVRALGGGMAPGWATDPKLLLAYAAWGVYGVYLLVRLLASWSPSRAAIALLVGLLLSLLVFVAPTASHHFLVEEPVKIQ